MWLRGTAGFTGESNITTDKVSLWMSYFLTFYPLSKYVPLYTELLFANLDSESTNGHFTSSCGRSLSVLAAL